MTRRASYILAFAAAAAAPAIVAGLSFWALGINAPLALQLALAALAVAVALVTVLGIPAVIALVRLGRLTWVACLMAGLAIAGVPDAIWAWPLRGVNSSLSASSWNGHALVPTLVNGEVTWAGWMQYARAVALAAAFGVIGGGAFWWVLTRALTRARNPPRPDSQR